MILRITIDWFGGKIEMSTITAMLFALVIYKVIKNHKTEKQRKSQQRNQSN